MFIDIHTHQLITKKNSIYNVILGKDNIPKTGWFSIGIHPWYLDDWSDSLQILENTLANQNQNLLFIGECGLDSNIDTELTVQEKIFKVQIELSERCKKPLVIHCVRAYNELIQIKKEVNPSQSWVIHGFNRKETIASFLLEKGFYLSVGYNYLQTSIGKEVVKNIPLNRLFFETDNETSVGIEEVYNLAAEIVQVRVEELKVQIKNNLWQVIG